MTDIAGQGAAHPAVPAAELPEDSQDSDRAAADENELHQPLYHDRTPDAEQVREAEPQARHEGDGDGTGADGTGRSGGLRPGEAAVPDPMAAPSEAEQEMLREEWQDAQLGFIDDPLGAAKRARQVTVEALDTHIEGLRDHLRALDAWQGAQSPDTEVLRAAVSGYRDLLDRVTLG